MPVQVLAFWSSLGRDAIHCIGHVGANVVVPVLVQAQRTARVLDKQVEDSDFVILELWKSAHHIVGDEVRALGLAGQRELLLEPGAHCDGGRGAGRICVGNWWGCWIERVGRDQRRRYEG